MTDELVPLPAGEWQDKPRERPASKPEITPRLDAALHVLVTSACTQEAAAKAAGLSRAHFCKMLAKPHVQARFQALLRERLSGMAPRALGTVDELLDCESSYVRLQSAVAVLDRVGLRPIEAAQAPGEVIIRIDLS
jgi:hypothetical protein